MRKAKAATQIRRKCRIVAWELDERRRRQWAAVEALEAGWSGVILVARATGLSRPTILAGSREFQKTRTRRNALMRSAMSSPTS